MPQNRVTYQKSAKGSQALASRDPALTPKLRSLLILVDGKRGPAELEKVAAALGDPGQLVAQLESLGFVEPSTQQAAQKAPPGPAAPAAAPDGVPTVPLKDAQRFAVRRLTDLLGPAAESLCMRIESTRTPAEFAQAIQRAETLLRDFGGASLAESFSREMQAHRPG